MKWLAFVLLGCMALVLFSNGRASGQSPCGPPAMETWDAGRVATPSIFSNRIEPEGVIVIDGTANLF